MAFGWDGKISLPAKIEKITYGHTKWNILPLVQEILTPTYWLFYLYMDHGNVLIWGGDSTNQQE